MHDKAQNGSQALLIVHTKENEINESQKKLAATDTYFGSFTKTSTV